LPVGATATRTNEDAGRVVERARPGDGAPPPAADLGDAPPVVDRSRWRRLVGSTRNRLLVAFLALLLVAGLSSIVGTRAVLTLRVDRRVDEALEQELEELSAFFTDGRDPVTGEPFGELSRALDLYFDRNVPSVDEAHVAFVEGELYRDRLRTFPLQQLPADVVEQWRAFSIGDADSLDGEFSTSQGTARFRAVRVEVADDSGAFVVAILPVSELREIRDLQSYGFLVVLAVVALAGLFAWWLTDRILAPVRELTETAQSIADVDRSARVKVVGTSEAAEMARTFNEMMDRLDDVHYSQVAFLQAVGHELRTPLTVATGHLELLEADEPDAERRATVGLVVDELARMGRLVDDLQSLAESAREDFVVPGPIGVQEFAHDVLARASVLADRQWRIDELRGDVVVGDAERLTEALLNLMDNAVNHTVVNDTIALGIVVDGDEVRLWVRDTGIGVHPDDMDRIFERFVRGRDATARYRGSGLGLAIVRSIAEAHGGTASVDADAGMGTRFSITIPRRDLAS
jgi:signal transduction histidine kinase